MSVALCQRVPNISMERIYLTKKRILQYTFMMGVKSLIANVIEFENDWAVTIVTIDEKDIMSEISLPDGTTLTEIYEPIIYK